VATIDYKPVARRAPLVIMLPFTVMVIVQTILQVKQTRPFISQMIAFIRWPTIDKKKMGKGFQIVWWMSLLMLMVYLLGHLFGTALFLVLFLRLVSHERWVLSLSLSLGITATLYILFEVILKIILYPGIINNYMAMLFGS
jgi:hypothetical protein